MTTFDVDALQQNLTYQSSFIFTLYAAKLIDAPTAKQALIQVNKLRALNKIQIAARGIEQQINHIADDLDETRLEILKLYENSCWD